MKNDNYEVYLMKKYSRIPFIGEWIGIFMVALNPLVTEGNLIAAFLIANWSILALVIRLFFLDYKKEMDLLTTIATSYIQGSVVLASEILIILLVVAIGWRIRDTYKSLNSRIIYAKEKYSRKDKKNE